MVEVVPPPSAATLHGYSSQVTGSDDVRRATVAGITHWVSTAGFWTRRPPAHDLYTGVELLRPRSGASYRAEVVSVLRQPLKGPGSAAGGRTAAIMEFQDGLAPNPGLAG